MKEYANSEWVGKFKEYVSLFGYDAWTADQVFDYIDKDGSGCLDYNEFRDLSR